MKRLFVFGFAWDLTTHENGFTLHGHTDGVRFMACFSNEDIGQFASAGMRRRGRDVEGYWDLESRVAIETFYQDDESSEEDSSHQPPSGSVSVGGPTFSPTSGFLSLVAKSRPRLRLLSDPAIGLCDLQYTLPS
jgi:hypothetical protein